MSNKEMLVEFIESLSDAEAKLILSHLEGSK